MRETYNSITLKNESGQFIGIDLSADYCAEHEWGISGIRDIFGIKDSVQKPFSQWWKNIFGEPAPLFGIEGKKINTFPDSLTFDFRIKNKQKVYFIGFSRSSYYKNNSEELKNHFNHYVKKSFLNKNNLACFWDENEFLIVSTNKEEFQELYEAFKNKDIAIWLGGGGVFQNAGLVVCIASKIPKDKLEYMRSADEDRYILKQKAVETGIYDILEKAKKEFFALSPDWKDEKKEDVHFWLNPRDQQTYDCGWYSVEELKQWIKNEGPIIKKKTTV